MQKAPALPLYAVQGLAAPGNSVVCGSALPQLTHQCSSTPISPGWAPVSVTWAFVERAIFPIIPPTCSTPIALSLTLLQPAHTTHLQTHIPLSTPQIQVTAHYHSPTVTDCAPSHLRVCHAGGLHCNCHCRSSGRAAAAEGHTHCSTTAGPLQKQHPRHDQQQEQPRQSKSCQQSF